MQLNFMDIKVINLLWSGTQATHVEGLPGQTLEGVEEETGVNKGHQFLPLAATEAQTSHFVLQLSRHWAETLLQTDVPW